MANFQRDSTLDVVSAFINKILEEKESAIQTVQEHRALSNIFFNDIGFLQKNSESELQLTEAAKQCHCIIKAIKKKMPRLNKTYEERVGQLIR